MKGRLEGWEKEGRKEGCKKGQFEERQQGSENGRKRGRSDGSKCGRSARQKGSKEGRERIEGKRDSWKRPRRICQRRSGPLFSLSFKAFAACHLGDSLSKGMWQDRWKTLGHLSQHSSSPPFWHTAHQSSLGSSSAAALFSDCGCAPPGGGRGLPACAESICRVEKGGPILTSGALTQVGPLVQQSPKCFAPRTS